DWFFLDRGGAGDYSRDVGGALQIAWAGRAVPVVLSVRRPRDVSAPKRRTAPCDHPSVRRSSFLVSFWWSIDRRSPLKRTCRPVRNGKSKGSSPHWRTIILRSKSRR